LIALVDHDIFKSIPLAERTNKWVYDTKGIWPDQKAKQDDTAKLRLAS
jgi:UDP-N-acetyl-D-mannosaminuronic acid dehydrogenase